MLLNTHTFIKESNDISGESLANVIRIKDFIKFSIFLDAKESFIFVLILNLNFKASELLFKFNVDEFNRNYKN